MIDPFCNSVAANSARDVGARLMALTIWGTRAGGGPYAALAALTNIPATILGALFYEFILMDSSRGKLWSSLSHYLNVDHLALVFQ